MAREPTPGVFRLVLPLPFPGFDRVNSYLLADHQEPVLVDCGIHDPGTPDHNWGALESEIAGAGPAVEQIAHLVVTHMHIDHYGMAGAVVEKAGCELWMHESTSFEVEIYRDPDRSIGDLRAMLTDHGVDPREIEELSVFEDWRGFIHSVVEPTVALTDGGTLEAGGRVWEMVHTPGHAHGHICLWDPRDRILISGDHLLPTVTPHIDFRRDVDEDPLGDFLASLQKVEALEPRLVLPGHGRPFEDGAQRARVIARHHDRRLGAILQVIRREPHSADDITDEIFGTELLNFQRRLALGEALAHLAYLRRQGDIERFTDTEGTYLYRKVDRRRRRQGE